MLCAKRLFRQVIHRIDGSVVDAHFEVQFHAVGAAAAHGGDGLPGGNLLAFAHTDLAVVCVGGEHAAGVIDEDEFAVTADAFAHIAHAAGGGGFHRGAGAAGDVDAFAGGAVKLGDDFAPHRPLQAAGCGAGTLGRGACYCAVGRVAGGCAAVAAAAAAHAQSLAHFELGGVFQVVPGHQAGNGLVEASADAVERVAALHAVVLIAGGGTGAGGQEGGA